MDTKTFLLAILALALAACSGDDEQATAQQEIRLFTEVSGTATRALNDATALQDAQLANGTKVSVKVKENASTPSVEYPLALYTADGNGVLSLPEGQKQYYPANGNGVNIYAWHPAGTPSTFEIQTDQTTADAYRASDLMWAGLSDVTSASTNHTLNFSHLLSKIVVRLEKAADFKDEDIAVAAITLGNGNLVTAGTFTASTGAFEPASSGTGTIALSQDAGTLDYAAIVVPQAISGKKINITIQDHIQSYSILTESFQAGKRYTYVLTLDYSGQISLLKAEITDWQNNEFTQSM